MLELDEDVEATHRDELERLRRVVPRQRACAPEHDAAAGQHAHGVDTHGIERGELRLREHGARPGYAEHGRRHPRRRGPDAARRVGARIDAGNRAAGRETRGLIAAQGIERREPRIIERRVRAAAHQGGDGRRGDVLHARPGRRRIDDHHGAAALSIGDRRLPGRRPDVGGARQRWNAENVEALGVLEQPEAALLRLEPRGRELGVGERGAARHHARDQGLAAAVEKKLLHGVAERQGLRQAAELRLELREAVHRHGCRDRPRRGGAEERGGRGRHAGDDMAARGHLFDVDPGGFDVHGSPPATMTGSQQRRGRRRGGPSHVLSGLRAYAPCRCAVTVYKRCFRTCFDFYNSVGAANAKTDASIQDNSGLSQGPALDPVIG